MKVTIKDIVDFYSDHPEEIGNIQVDTRYGFKTIEYADVTAQDSDVYEFVLEDGSSIKTSPEHRLWINDDWMFVKDAKAGDECSTRNGTIRVKSVTKLDYTDDLYDLQVAEVHEFYANDIVSHNSTFLDALTFVLFGKPFRKIKIPQLYNTINEKDCMVEVDFEANGHKYKVRRGIKPVVFEVYMNGELINQDAKNRDYQKVLEKQILKLNFKSFTQIVVLGSATFQPFMQLPTYHRREVIEDLLDLQIFSAMADDLKIKVSHNKEKLQELRIAVKYQNDKILAHKKFIAEIKRNAEDQAADHQKDIDTAKENIERKIIDLKAVEESLIELSQLNEKRLDLNEKLKNKANVINNLQRDKNGLAKELVFYTKNDFCPTCEQVLSHETKKEHQDKIESKIDSIERTLRSEEAKRDQILSDLKAYDDVIDNQATAFSKKNKAESEILALKSYIKRIEQTASRLVESSGDTSKQEVELNECQQELAEIENKQRKILVRLKYFEEIEKLISDSGIKSQIIKTYIPMINSLINKYLKKMDFFVSFNLNENFEETIKSRYRDTFSYYSFSEGQKLRIDLALLFTWREISQLKNSTNTNLIIFDEITDRSLDDEGLQSFIELLYGLGEKINSYVISPKGDAYRDKFNRVLIAQMDSNFSKLVEG